MAETKTAQSQQSTSASNGGAGYFNPFKGVIEEHLRRTESFWKDVAEAEAKGAEQAKMAIDESAKLMKETLDYGLKLSNEWRRMAMDATRRAAETVQPKV